MKKKKLGDKSSHLKDINTKRKFSQKPKNCWLDNFFGNLVTTSKNKSFFNEFQNSLSSL